MSTQARVHVHRRVSKSPEGEEGGQMSVEIIGQHLFVTGSRQMKLLNIWLFSRMSGHTRAAVLASPKNTKIHWKAVHCKGDETELLQCPKITWNGGKCSLLAAITCTQQQGCMKSDFKLKLLPDLDLLKSVIIVDSFFGVFSKVATPCAAHWRSVAHRRHCWGLPRWTVGFHMRWPMGR